MFGGSFAPIHTEHINVALDAKRHLESEGYKVERVILSPSADKLLEKKLGEDMIPLAARAEMARLAMKDLGLSDVVEVSTGAGEEAQNFEGKLKRTQLANWAAAKYPETMIVTITGAGRAVDLTPAI